MLHDDTRTAQARIPTITCPVCGSHMFLCTDDRLGERMTFGCACGFEYRQSAMASSDRML